MLGDIDRMRCQYDLASQIDIPFFTKNRRICNYLRIKRLFGLHGNWVTRWQPFLFQSSLLFCINDITPDTQRYNFFMNEQKDGAFFIIAV